MVVEHLEKWGKIRRGISEEERVQDVRALAFPDGLMVQENLVWLALRAEFGIRGPAVPHLAKSVRVPKKLLAKSLEKIFKRVVQRRYAPPPPMVTLSQEEKEALAGFGELVLAKKAPKRKDVS